jgi:D-alanyl-D-alanine carboxypeptidase/D-alanyl-D-alanine-endopeptidase (penicillin-binding protein 4)
VACATATAAAQEAASPAAKITSAAEECARSTKATVGVCVIDLRTGKQVVGFNENGLFAPASNQKVLTGAFALARLGGDFQFETKACLAGNDVWVLGSADPTFGDPRMAEEANATIYDELDRWAAAIAKALPGGIAGDLVVCRAACPNQATPQESYRPSTWPKDQFHLEYCAPAGALNFNDNCIDVTFRVAAGKVTPAFAPASRFIGVTNRITVGSRHLWAMAVNNDDSAVTLTGTATGSSNVPLCVPVNNPPLFFGRVLADRLERAGVKLGGKIVAADAPPEGAGSWKVLARTATPLAAAVRRANKHSLNMAAESIFLRAGDGTWAGSAKLFVETLQKDYRVDPNSLIVLDGCGLSHGDRASPLAFAKVLGIAAGRKDARALIDSLPIAGVDGTMEGRLEAPPYRGRVLAKTGYIMGVSCLSGYILDSQLRPTLAMSVLCNHAPSAGPCRKLEDSISSMLVDWLDAKAEK